MTKKIPDTVYKKQIDLLFGRLPFSLAISFIICLLFPVFIPDFPHPGHLRIWMGLVFFVVLFRGVTSFFYHKRKSKDQQDAQCVLRFYRLFIVGAVLAGICWGAVGGWLYPLTSDLASQHLLVLVLVGIAGGSISTLSYRLLPSFLFICLTLCPIFAGLYLTEGSQNFSLGLVLILYLIFLLKNSQLFQQNTEQMLLLKEDALTREEKLRVANREARRASHAKSRFLANMSHEIRTPMSSIIGRTQLVLENDLDPETTSHMKTIQTSSENLLVLINEILDFSKIEAGELKIDKTPFDLYATVESSLEVVKVLGNHKPALKITCSIAADVPRAVIGDAVRIRQVLLNLLSNGVKFTQEGQVELLVDIAGEGKSETQNIRFRVRDTGKGIAYDKQETIFLEFTQEDDSISRRFDGTGLGLTICQRLCHLMGGVIEVHSVPDVGSTFVFSLPLLQCSPAELPVAKELKNEGASEKTDLAPLFLLLVEDNEPNRLMARFTLEKQGHRVVEARNGLEALRALVDNRFDVVLMDVQMPLLDGILTTRIIRSLETGTVLENLPEKSDQALLIDLSRSLTGKIPIIALTANAMSGDREICLEAGMDDYLAKPFKWNELKAILIKNVAT